MEPIRMIRIAGRGYHSRELPKCKCSKELKGQELIIGKCEICQRLEELQSKAPAPTESTSIVLEKLEIARQKIHEEIEASKNMEVPPCQPNL
jgi:hypothetical protein